MNEYTPKRNAIGTIVTILLIAIQFPFAVTFSYAKSDFFYISVDGILVPILDILTIIIPHRFIYIFLGFLTALYAIGLLLVSLFGKLGQNPILLVILSGFLMVWAIAVCIPLRIHNFFVAAFRPFSLIKAQPPLPQHAMASLTEPVSMSQAPVSPVMVE